MPDNETTDILRRLTRDVRAPEQRPSAVLIDNSEVGLLAKHMYYLSRPQRYSVDEHEEMIRAGEMDFMGVPVKVA